MAIFVVSDWHLGETRMSIIGRPFVNDKQMIETLIFNHNSVVSKDDKVFVVGDVCYQQTPWFLESVSMFNGKKTLIRGNHDRVFSDEELLQYFEEVIPDGDGIEIEHLGAKYYLTHYPTRGRIDMFNLVGHIHSAWKYQLNMLNVSVDVHNFFPVNLDSIEFHINAISNFYDDDVWCAYNEINSSYLDKRGKKSSYFH
jgi:calcineurin-like phosphoesterase family protein